MTSGSAKCPYCQHDNPERSEICANCGNVFPWIADIKDLQNQVKEREVSRLRATATLVEEAFEASRGGKPVSLSAIKGFITAWILPRTVIILGSVLGAAILGVQTYILWNQTKVMTLQTQAAQLEQSAILRERISRTSATMSHLARLEKIYAVPFAKGCQAAECKASTLRQTLELLRQDVPQPPSGASKEAWTRLSSILRDIQGRVSDLSGIRELDTEGKQSSQLGLVGDLLRPATVQCRFDPDRSALYLDQASAFLLIAANGFWLDQPINSPATLLELAAKFPQVKQNTDMGLIQLETAINRVPSLLSGKVMNEKDVGNSYNVTAIFADMEKLRTNVARETSALQAACREANEKDKSALKLMEV